MYATLNRRRGFTLIEVMFAMIIGAVLTSSTYYALLASRVQQRKSFEMSIAADFAQMYVEHLRNNEFTDIVTGHRWSAGFAGLSPNIPANGTWVNLDTDTYKTIYPDLEWLEGRRPQFSVTLTPANNPVPAPRSRHISVTVRWQRLRVGTGNVDALNRDLSVTIDSTVFQDFK